MPPLLAKDSFVSTAKIARVIGKKTNDEMLSEENLLIYKIELNGALRYEKLEIGGI